MLISRVRQIELERRTSEHDPEFATVAPTHLSFPNKLLLHKHQDKGVRDSAQGRER
jgi:hypothetical protein